MSVLMVAVRD